MADRPTKKGATRPSQRRANAALRAQTSAGGRKWLLGVAVVVVAGVALVAAIIMTRSKGTSVPTGSDAAAVIRKVTSVPASVSNEVGIGTVQNIPKALNEPALTAGGKPEVLYIGAEYCPYCATERWAMVEALSRFGTFKNLGLSHSATADVFPDTPTFTFHGSTYTSPYLVFSPVETQSNEPNGQGGYKTLDTPTPEQQQLLLRLGNGGSIPFIDVGGPYVISGVTFDPQVLQGKSFSQIADAMNDASTDIAKGAVGSANLLTALICKATGNQPGTVCKAPAITKIAASLK